MGGGDVGWVRSYDIDGEERGYTAVLDGVRAGQSLEQLKNGIKLEKYQSFAMHRKWLKMNIEGVYKRIGLHRRGN